MYSGRSVSVFSDMAHEQRRRRHEQEIERQREQRAGHRHFDTLCCSIMTLTTIAMGGLFAFLGISLTSPYDAMAWSMMPAYSTHAGTLIALALYVTGVVRGMRVLMNQSQSGKPRTFRRFQSHCIAIIVAIAITVSAGIITSIQSDQSPPNLGTQQSGTPSIIR